MPAEVILSAKRWMIWRTSSQTTRAAIAMHRLIIKREELKYFKTASIEHLFVFFLSIAQKRGHRNIWALLCGGA